MNLLAKLRSRLVVRLYLTGLFQFAALASTFFVLTLFVATPVEEILADEAKLVATTLCGDLADPEALRRDIARVHDTLGAAVEVTRADGSVLAKVDRARGPRSPLRPALRTSCADPAGRAVTVSYDKVPAAPHPAIGAFLIAATLLMVAVPAWFTARSIGRPLARIAAVAHHFGHGKLDARVALTRADELGEVAASFDQMADRVVGLLRAEKELLANVSHELRSPLARIRVALDLAAEGAQMEHESLTDIARDLGELERVVADVLATARLTMVESAPGGTLPLRLEETDVAKVVDLAAARFRALHPSRPLEVTRSPDLPKIQADQVLLRRVLDNLLDNADKYTDDERAPIALAATEADGALVVEVRDRGVGMSARDLARAFEPFFRSDPSRSRATGGLGLGLALSRRIVEAHGGALSLASAPGQGTTARVVLRALVLKEARP